MDIQDIARQQGIKFKSIKQSTRQDKKYMITLLNGKVIHFGARGYEDFTTHKDEERRVRFHNRFKNNKGYSNPESGLYYSARLLW